MSSPYLWEATAAKGMPVSADSIWALWDRPSRWADWNPAIKSAHLDGPFTEGATALVRFHRRPALRFTVTALERRRAFTDEAQLPGARFGHEHRIWPGRHGIEVTHRIYLAGPLARIWGALVGARIRRELDQFVTNEERLARELEGA